MADTTNPYYNCPTDVLAAISNLGTVLGSQHMIAQAQQASATQVLADQLCAVGKHVGDTGHKLSQQLGDEALGITKHVGDTTHRLAQSLGDASQRLSVQIGESTLGVTSRVDAQGAAIRDSIGDVRREVASEACDVAKVVSTEAREMTGFNSQNFNFMRKDVTDGFRESISFNAQNFAAGRKEAADGFKDLTRDIERDTREVIANVERNFQQTLAKTCMDTENVRRDVATANKEILLKQAEDTNLLVRVMDKEAASIHLGQRDLLSRSFQSEATILAAVAASKYELSKQLAECCCEMKEDGGETRELINAVENRRVAEELAEMRSENRHLRSQINIGIGVGGLTGTGVAAANRA